jgi:GMP synthase-like glutamine amidotransferase
VHVLAFEHTPLEGIGSIAASLERHHIACQIVDRPSSLATLPGLADAAALILMGGPMSVNDSLPWIATEMEAIRQAVARRRPVLGICLGAQLVAKALVARVYPMPAKEIGWEPVYWTRPALADPLFGGLAQPEMLFHWHGETFDLPEGATHLAHSEACRNQAFRVSDNVYALQFHIEVTSAIIEDWCRNDESCGSAHELKAPIDPYANAPRLEQIGTTVFDRWCELLR